MISGLRKSSEQPSRLSTLPKNSKKPPEAMILHTSGVQVGRRQRSQNRGALDLLPFPSGSRALERLRAFPDSKAAEDEGSRGLALRSYSAAQGT